MNVDLNRIKKLAGLPTLTEGAGPNAERVTAEDAAVTFTIGDLLDLLSSSKFERWYDKGYRDFIEGEENAASEAEIAKQLIKMLK
jgi:hypothetical protein